MKIFAVTFFALYLSGFSISAFAQTNAQIEKELVAAFKEVQKYGTYGGNYDDGKLTEAENNFQEKLLRFTKNSATLKYAFPALGDLIIIATAEDGELRTYSWDEESGGTMHDYSVVYQYQGADGKTYSRVDKQNADEEDTVGGSFVYDIFTVNAKSEKIYALCTTFIGSTTDHYGSVSLDKVTGNDLIDKVKLFKTKSGLTDSIGFEYDFYSVADWDGRPLKLIRFDKTMQTIKIPVVIQDKESPLGKVTKNFISYKFDGTYFVKVK